MSGEAEVGNNHVVPSVPDEGLRRAHRLSIGVAPSERIVQGRVSGSEILEPVPGAQSLRDPSIGTGRGHYFCVTRRLARARRARAAFGLEGAASASQSSSKNRLGATVV